MLGWYVFTGVMTMDALDEFLEYLKEIDLELTLEELAENEVTIH